MSSNDDLINILSDSSFKAIIFPILIIALASIFKTISRREPPSPSPQSKTGFNWKNLNWKKIWNGEEFNWESVAVGFDFSIGSIFLLFTEAIDTAKKLAEPLNNVSGSADTHKLFNLLICNVNVPDDNKKLLKLLIVAFFFAFIPVVPAFFVKNFGWNTDKNKLNALGAILPIIFGGFLIWIAYSLIK